jgi:hypothetical protein
MLFCSLYSLFLGVLVYLRLARFHQLFIRCSVIIMCLQSFVFCVLFGCDYVVFQFVNYIWKFDCHILNVTIDVFEFLKKKLGVCNFNIVIIVSPWRILQIYLSI